MRQDAASKIKDKHLHALPVDDPIWIIMTERRRSIYELFAHAFPHTKDCLRRLLHTHEYFKADMPQEADIPEYKDYCRNNAPWHLASPSTIP